MDWIYKPEKRVVRCVYYSLAQVITQAFICSFTDPLLLTLNHWKITRQ